MPDAGIPAEEEFVQDNHSRSSRGVVRGMHFHIGEGVAKLVRCSRGRIVDVNVDLRKGSPTYGQWEGVELDDENMRVLYVPVGFAHGFCVLSEIADVLYKQTAYYDPAVERGIAWDDPEIAIEWPLPVERADRLRARPPRAQAGRGRGRATVSLLSCSKPMVCKLMTLQTMTLQLMALTKCSRGTVSVTESRSFQRCEPALRSGDAFGIGAHHRLDRIGQRSRGGPIASSIRGQQDQACMLLALRESLGGDWAEVTEVVGDDRAVLLHADLHQTLVRRLEQIWPLGDRLHICSAPAKLLGDLHRELLVEQRLHEASALCPASQAA